MNLPFPYQAHSYHLGRGLHTPPVTQGSHPADLESILCCHVSSTVEFQPNIQEPLYNITHWKAPSLPLSKEQPYPMCVFVYPQSYFVYFEGLFGLLVLAGLL